MNKTSKIYVAGHRGMVGSAICRRLKAEGYNSIVTRTHAELDLMDPALALDFTRSEKPDFIFIAAAKVGGIYANSTYRADFLYENLMIEANLIHGAHIAGIQHLMFLGSSCIYPRECPQPMLEEYLLTGPLEYTNEPYAIAKIAGIKLCESYRLQYKRNYLNAMPANLYGLNDNYDLENSHVLPALIRKVHEAKSRGDSELVVWGSGTPRREFLYVEDLAEACVYLMELQTAIRRTGKSFGMDLPSLVNIGSGQDASIHELAKTIMRIIGFNGDIVFDSSKPDGMPRKMLDSTRMNELGWHARTTFEEGVALSYQDFCKKETATAALQTVS